jgi:hypothetical protein
MLSYLAFLHHGIESAGDNPLEDGRELARNCLEQLDALGDPDQFPPRLLILLASPAYLESLQSEQLLNGVLQAFDEVGHRGVELMGCSAAAVFFNKRIHRRGALLICLASRLLGVRVRASPDVGDDHEGAVSSLLRELNLITEDGEEVHSFANPTLLALFPGYGVNSYLAPALHESLRRQLRARVPIFGGVASAADPRRIRSGILFANRKIYNKAIVAANIECGAPLGISLTQGLTDTHEVFRVAEVSPQDGRVIRRFEGGPAAEMLGRMKKETGSPVFANFTLDHDPTIHVPVLEGRSLKLTREVRVGEIMHLLRAEPATMRQALRGGIGHSMERAWLLNPIAALAFRCAGLLRNEREIGMNLEHECALVEYDISLHNSLEKKSFVGCFVDGEAGVDANGKSVFSNWANATMVFGDELRFRTPVYRGFEKLAYFAAMKMAATYKEGVDRLTQLVYDIGFPGAMLSFVLRANSQDKGALIPQSASGLRYKKLLDERTPYRLDSDDVLAAAALEKEPRLILDSRKEGYGSMRAAAAKGIISQYLIPLTGDDGEVRALLQVDLGDISYDTQIYQSEKTVLTSLGNIVSSSVNRTLNSQEGKIVRRLGQAMNECLSDETIKQGLTRYLERALDAFGLKKGHIRVAKHSRQCLSMVAGVGDHLDEWTRTRRHIDLEESDSPTVRAFAEEKVVIVNDARNNPAHQEMCDYWESRGKVEFARMLRGIGSYANVPFRGARHKRGVITLLSSRPWFFTPFHEAALQALGDRVGVLYETLSSKVRSSFLLGVSPRYSLIDNLSKTGDLLKNEVEWFAEAAKAEFVSLYLWDGDRRRYVLRAQHGWAEPEWVNAAYYNEDEFWTGKAALSGSPRHIPDLYTYYKAPRSSVRYVAAAFGQELSPEFTVEAFPLEVRVAKERLGVITLYRRIRPSSESGFTTTETRMLQQGADNLASLAKLLQSDRTDRWRKRELTRRQEVYDAMVPAEGAESADPFERRVCVQALKSYRAIKAGFYKVDASGEYPQHELQAYLEREPQTGRIAEAKCSISDSGLVEETILRNYKKNNKRLPTERVEWDSDHRKDYKKSGIDGLVKRACIPLISEKRLVGVLDLHWSFDPSKADEPDYRHGGSYLLMLGEVIGSAYGRRKMKREANDKLDKAQEKLKRSSDVVKISTTYVRDIQHGLSGVIQQMRNEVDALKAQLAAGAEADVKSTVDKLSRHVGECRTSVNRMINMGTNVIDMHNVKFPVASLIQSVLLKRQARCEDLRITVCESVVPQDLLVNVDQRLMTKALGNIIDNAIESMIGRETRYLGISATPNADGKNVTIAIKDTGVGMTPAVLEQVRRGGIFRRDGRLRLGVSDARIFLGIYGGELDYDSTLGEGTEARLIFPLN